MIQIALWLKGRKLYVLASEGFIACPLDPGIQADGIKSIWNIASLMVEGKIKSIVNQGPAPGAFSLQRNLALPVMRYYTKEV